MLRTVGIVAAGLVLALAGCSSDADVVSQNLSKDADNFKVPRRVVFYNGINGDYVLEIDGLCSVDSTDAKRLAVTCKTGKNEYKKHFLGLSDNVTWFAEQMSPTSSSASHYEVNFKPSVIVPDVDVP